jgi:hypothetical protein
MLALLGEMTLPYVFQVVVVVDRTAAFNFSENAASRAELSVEVWSTLSLWRLQEGVKIFLLEAVLPKPHADEASVRQGQRSCRRPFRMVADLT